MRTLLPTLMLAVLLLAACGGNAVPDVTETMPAETLTPVLEQATEPPTQPATNTPIPSTQTPASPAYLFRDDFDDELGDGWQWIGEDTTHWSLTTAPGALQIALQPSNMNDGEAKNFLMRAAPGGDFEIATLINFHPTSNFQFAGLLIYQAQGSAMQFGRAFARCPVENACIGNAIYFDIVEGGAGGKPNFATAVQSESQAYLRLQREGQTYTGYYSEDGTDWITIGQHETSLIPQYVGLIAAQAYEAETTADFDYFTIEELP